ncbi:tyrosine-type recombinase/integrase [Erwinia phyllosphaerae]|uniref:tyrosine-type recombinase/integrase n=1 Tax=Erwinia phyllosphaerae TaxID=2853256 RepID=UPI001FEF4E52|nr:site-specific integrase [Erwinia phyllosphaerae]
MKKGEFMDRFGIKTFKMKNGERYCIIKNKKTGIPVFYPCLFITTQLRNSNESIKTIETQAGCIALFYRFLFMRKIDIEKRIQTARFLDNNEIDLLRDFVGKRMRIPKVTNIKDPHPGVCSATKYIRLTTIAKYLEWLCQLTIKSKDDGYRKISYFVTKIKARRPKIKFRNSEGNFYKTIEDEQLKILLSVIDPECELNPFDKKVRQRNQLIVMILHSLGIRCGELLNLKVEDIDFAGQIIFIRRRADSIEDTRVNQPLVKTIERDLPMSDQLTKLLHSYITGERKANIRKKKHGYLFITQKEGYTRGDPLSVPSYHKIIYSLRNIDSGLNGLTGHKFRHTWNFLFSKQMDESTEYVSEEMQEQMRSRHMGWEPGSGTARIYNRRFIVSKSEQAALGIQNTIFQKRSGVSYE